MAIGDITVRELLLVLIVPASNELTTYGQIPFGDEVPVPQSSSTRVLTDIRVFLAGALLLYFV